MTFYEAALQVLEKEGKPLHFKFITERAVNEKLLSHVGKDPEVVMYSRLAAMARRKGDRRIVATEPGTFGLLDWGVQEDPTALDVQVVPVPDETEPPLRPRERHPLPNKEIVRLAGRGERPRKYREDRERDEQRTRRKLQSLPELAFEVLSSASGPMSALDVAATLRDSDKVNEDLGTETLLQALREDNRRRQSQDRRPLFIISEAGEVSLDKAGTPGEAIPVELQAAFAQALGVPLEGVPAVGVGVGASGARPETKSERAGPGAQRLLQQAREHQKNIARVLRRRVGELEAGALELLGVTLLEVHGFREVRVAKRTREGVVLTARKREGLLDVRYAVRLLKGSREVSRVDIADLRRDAPTYNVQAALLIAAGEVSRDARNEVLTPGVFTLLWCSDALAEKLIEKKVGATTIQIEVPDVAESFFRTVREQGDLEDKRREERRVERESREERERSERAARDAAAAVAAGSTGSAAVATSASTTTSAETSSATTAAPTPEAASTPGAAPTSTSSEQVIEVRVDLSAQPPPLPPPPASIEAPESIAAALALQEAREAGESARPASSVTEAVRSTAEAAAASAPAGTPPKSSE
jgi:hypothetical protein